MKYSLIIFLLLVTGIASSQERVSLSKNQLNINIAPLSLSYEGKIDDNKSFTSSAGIAYAFEFAARQGGGTETAFIAAPYFTSSVRNYYQRKNVRKSNLQNNSGNYIGIYASYMLEPFGEPDNLTEATAFLENTNILTVGPVWGIQRNYASGIHLGLSIGPGFKTGKYIKDSFTFAGEFEFGFVLSSK
ncbi:hypothetical protein SAMN05421640_0723 [Ekhidna lutea]|uniref:Outer membrane protein beta-barrel domain-containing protein n=1 Tax=Ekhidna lutea TaxID=447679 RepID=A0A239FKV3_EKHLU|nr:hypothetical protein [Ekhidna lutea]SNS57475.1 hypothetical protein SAMN05421640_0723 [Ekhidna lutea]